MLQRALTVIERITDETKEQPYLWKLRAQVLLERKDYAQALQALLVYSYNKELSAEETMLIGNLFNVVNAPSTAARYYLSSLKQNKKQYTVSNAEKIVTTYLAAHETEKGHQFLEKAVREMPSARLWLLLGKILYDKGIYYDAGEAFRKSAGIDPLEGQSYLMLAYGMIKLEDKDSSLAALRKAMDFPKQKETAGNLLENLPAIRAFERGSL